MDIKVKVCKIIILDTAALTSVFIMLLDHRNEDQQKGSPCSNLPFLFRENVMHRPLSLERN
jgi:hypothetical protein